LIAFPPLSPLPNYSYQNTNNKHIIIIKNNNIKMPQRPLLSRVVCVILLLVALLVLREKEDLSKDDDNNTATTTTSTAAAAAAAAARTRWIVWTALLKHPPSLRIFRSMLEWNILLWGTVVSLTLWYRYVGKDMVVDLLFDHSHMDVVDDWGAADDIRGRKRTYIQLQQQQIKQYDKDDEHDDDDTDVSQNWFHDPNDKFSKIMTGTQQQQRRQQQQGEEVDNDDGCIDGAGQQPKTPFHNVAKDEDRKENNKRIHRDDTPQPQTQPQDKPGNPIQKNWSQSAAFSSSSSSSSSSSFDAQEISQAPSVHAVAGAALDMLLPILVSLFLFALLSAQKTAQLNPRLPRLAPLLPLLLVAYLVLTQLVRPWKARKRFLIVVGWTMGAPLFPVTFRDGFIGDIFTSTVRPLQDVAFTICYILSGFQGFYTDGYEGFWDSVNHNPQHLNDDDDAIAAAVPTEAPFAHSMLPALETSWFLHTVLLPMCMVSPLWWRFLQNLRQTHDNRRRWPYLGNAFKYLLAAEVAMFGVFDPSKQKTFLWLGSFVIATLYQVWWDIFMDWDLLVPNQNSKGFWSWICGYRLRENRLYPSKSFYAAVMLINITLRFCWTLSFLPPRYLNQAGVLSDTFQQSDWSRALAPAIASAEIIRRTMWGWIRLEAEAIKVKEEQENPVLPPAALLELQYRGENPEESFRGVLDGMQPMSMGQGLGGQHRWSFSKRQGIIPVLFENLKTLEYSSELQILAELSLWATVFTTLGLIAAAHRMTL